MKKASSMFFRLLVLTLLEITNTTDWPTAILYCSYCITTESTELKMLTIIIYASRIWIVELDG